MDCFAALAMTTVRSLPQTEARSSLPGLPLGLAETPDFTTIIWSAQLFPAWAIEMLAVQLYAVRLHAVQPMLFLGLCCLLLGFPQGLPLRLGFQAQPFGSRLGRASSCASFTRRTSAADRFR